MELNGEPTEVATLEEHADQMMIYSVAVKPDAQRKGYGTACLTLQTNELSSLGCTKFGSTRTSGCNET